jgi:hypothetical protein
LVAPVTSARLPLTLNRLVKSLMAVLPVRDVSRCRRLAERLPRLLADLQEPDQTVAETYHAARGLKPLLTVTL